MNCMRHFSISHYFAKLDYMHVRLTLKQNAFSGPRAGPVGGVFFAIITQ
jgi:hypothetical protein